LTEILIELGIDRDRITPEARCRADLGLDSTDLVAMGMAVESHVSFPMDSAVFPALETVAEMVELIQEALQRADGRDAPANDAYKTRA